MPTGPAVWFKWLSVPCHGMVGRLGLLSALTARGCAGRCMPGRLIASYTNSARVTRWRCRVCAGLRYTSEGGALVIHPCTDLGRQIEALEGPSRSPRPEPWYPYVFADPVMRKQSCPGNDGRLLVLAPTGPKKSECPPFRPPYLQGTRKIANRPFQRPVSTFWNAYAGHTTASALQRSDAGVGDSNRIR